MEFPPPTPFTDHVTLVFELPVTVAANCCVCPRKIAAVPGDTETVVVGVGGGEVPPEDGEPPALPHPASVNAASKPKISAQAARVRFFRRSFSRRMSRVPDLVQAVRGTSGAQNGTVTD